ncbi:MAG: reductive dehalogenase [Deltaproteobacteria bacterium]|nr:reductive dehalogenase [Deltaproteobacteria bacterium]
MVSLKEMQKLEDALRPYEKKLQSQEKLRRLLGVNEVERPTYERYIIKPIERFDRRKNAFLTLLANNPFGAEFRTRFRERTGVDHYSSPLPYSELSPEDRIGQSLTAASWRLCREYEPKSLPITDSGGRVEITDRVEMTRLIKKVALFFGAELVRITRIDPRWIYQDVDISHPYAIIAVVSHPRPLNQTSPSHLSSLAVAHTYSNLKFITTQLADFIRGLGYDAVYRETLGRNPEMLMVPMAIDAGVGEFARNGRVLSPEFGINMRLKAVTTDLPIEPDKPISFGVHEFCLSCEECARQCPAGAIPFGPPSEKLADPLHNNPGFRKWYIHAERCLTFWAVNRKKWSTCGGRCINFCPWNKPIRFWHNMVRWAAIHSPAKLKRILALADRFFCHGK